MIYEFCAENVTLLEKAMQAGARRIELCDNGRNVSLKSH